jgi:hypothetical protein
LFLNVPQYTIVAANANVNCYYYLASGTPAFVTLDGDPYNSPKIKVSTTDVAHTGVYSITIFFKDNFSGLVRSDTFELTVSCVRAIALRASLTNINYWITDTVQTRTPLYDLTPSGCPNELTYTVTLANLAALPHQISFDSSTKVISVQETDYSLTGTYRVLITVVDPKTNLINTEANLNVTIFCTKTIDLVTGTSIGDFTYQVDLDVPWQLNATLPSYIQNPS